MYTSWVSYPLSHTHTHVWTQVHLTDAGAHVHGGHEAVIAETAIFSGDVRTLATVADVRRVFTLVDVCGERRGSVWEEQCVCKCVCQCVLELHDSPTILN